MLLLLLPALVQGWSGDGHRLIGKIASEFLRESGKNFLAEHLTEQRGDVTKVEKALIDHAIYADTVEWSHDLHFSHTPYRACAPFEMDRDCPLVGGARRCIVTAIANYTVRASDVELSVEERAEAVKFLIHLIGDIHNPLHVGFAEDRGGTQIHLSNPPGETLHNIWDDVLLGNRHGLSSSAAVKSRDPLVTSLEDVSSEESATVLAASMASNTAIMYTCEYAYRDEARAWIQKNSALSEEYLETRSEIAVELVRAAGLRLAELLNHIGKAFSTKKYLKENSAGIVISSSKERENRFLALDFDFEPESLLFVGTKIDEVVKNIPQEEAAALVEDAPEEKGPVSIGKVSASKKARMRKARVKQLIDTVVLVKRRGLYVITGSERLAGDDPEHYFPAMGNFLSVSFQGNKEVVTFLFDTDHFGEKNCSEEFIIRALMKIRQIPYEAGKRADLGAESSSSSVSLEKARDMIPPFKGEIRVVGSPHQVYFSSAVAGGGSVVVPAPPPAALSKSAKKKEKQLRKLEENDWKEILGSVPSKEEIMERRFKQNIENVVSLQVRSLYFFLHRRSLEDTSIPMIKASRFNLVMRPTRDSEQIVIFIVDNLIFDGSPTSEMLTMLSDSMERNYMADFNFALRTRPSLVREFTDVEKILFGRSPERTHRFSAVKYFTFFTLDNEAHSHLHWSVHPEEIPGLVPSSIS